MRCLPFYGRRCNWVARGMIRAARRAGRVQAGGAVPIGSYLSMLMGGDVRGRVNW